MNNIPQFILDLYEVSANENGESHPGDPYLGTTVNCLFAQSKLFVKSITKSSIKIDYFNIKNFQPRAPFLNT